MEPKDPLLEDIVKDAVAQQIDIPEFQRGFVWGPGKVKDLVDSLWNGYPVGTFLYWRSSEYVSPRSAHGTETQRLWIIDGQQRITAFCLILGKKPYWFSDAGEWNVLYKKYDVMVNIRSAKNALEFGLPNPIRTASPEWNSIREILKNEDLSTMAMDIIEKLGKKSDMQAFKEIHQKLQSIQKIKEYPTKGIIVRHDVEDVAEIFSRLNTAGVKIKETDVAVALIAARNEGWVREEFIPFLKDLEASGYDFEPALVIRTISALGKQTTKLKDIPDGFWATKEFHDTWDGTKKAIGFIIKNLREEYGVLSSDILPAKNTLIPLFVMYDWFGDDFDFKYAFYWFLRATWDGRYSGSAITVLNQDIKTISESTNFVEGIDKLLLTLQVPEAISDEEFLKNYSKEKFLRLMYYLVIFQNQAMDWRQQVRIGYDKRDNTLNYGFQPQWHHFFPRSVIKGKIDEDKINAFANITILNPGQSAFRSAPEKYIEKYEIPEEYIKQQLIPTDTNFWKVGNYNGFLEERKKTLKEAVNRFFDSLKKDN